MSDTPNAERSPGVPVPPAPVPIDADAAPASPLPRTSPPGRTPPDLSATAPELAPHFPSDILGTQVVLSSSAPGELRAHWSLDYRDLERFAASFPMGADRPRPVLRLRRSCPQGGAESVGEPCPIGPARDGAGETGFRVGQEDGRYHAELGLASAEGGWLMLARSNRLDNAGGVGPRLPDPALVRPVGQAPAGQYPNAFPLCATPGSGIGGTIARPALPRDPPGGGASPPALALAAPLPIAAPIEGPIRTPIEAPATPPLSPLGQSAVPMGRALVVPAPTLPSTDLAPRFPLADPPRARPVPGPDREPASGPATAAHPALSPASGTGPGFGSPTPGQGADQDPRAPWATPPAGGEAEGGRCPIDPSRFAIDAGASERSGTGPVAEPLGQAVPSGSGTAPGGSGSGGDLSTDPTLVLGPLPIRAEELDNLGMAVSLQVVQTPLVGRPLRLGAVPEPSPTSSSPILGVPLAPLDYGSPPRRVNGLAIEAQLCIVGQAAPGSLVDLFGIALRVGPGGRFKLTLPVDDPDLLRRALECHPPPELTTRRDE